MKILTRVSGRPKGRPKGARSITQLDITEKLRRLKCDPIEGMVRLVSNPKTTPELRAKLYCELAQYVFPKRRAVEQTIEDNRSEAIRAEEARPALEALLSRLDAATQTIEGVVRTDEIPGDLAGATVVD